MSTIGILIPVHLPDWWRDLAVGRYAAHACAETQLVGIMPDADCPAPSASELADILSRKGWALAESSEVDAYILDCFGDPALAELAQRLERPVIGVGFAGLCYAHSTFRRFAVITSEDGVASEIVSAARSYGVAGHLGVVDAIGISAGDVPGRRDGAFAALRTHARRLEDDVSAIVLGCTELAEFAAPLERALREDPGRPICVVNPIAVAVRWAEMHVAVRAASLGAA